MEAEMATATKRAPARADGQSAALERLESSLEAAQKALVSLRDDVRSGGRDLLKTAEKSIAAARKDSEKLAKAVRADVGDLQKAVTSPPAKKPPAAKRRKPAATKA
jgi:hypothetical protein